MAYLTIKEKNDNVAKLLKAKGSGCHCEERSDAAISSTKERLLAMTGHTVHPQHIRYSVRKTTEIGTESA